MKTNTSGDRKGFFVDHTGPLVSNAKHTEYYLSWKAQPNGEVASTLHTTEAFWKTQRPEDEANAVRYLQEMSQEWYDGTLIEGHTIWPPHCIVGTPGWCVRPSLMAVLEQWTRHRNREITWVFKGQNRTTEAFSALRAACTVADDPRTQMNHALVRFLADHTGNIYICGEARTHCVNLTIRDLIKGFRHLKKDGAISQLRMLWDCASDVNPESNQCDSAEIQRATALRKFLESQQVGIFNAEDAHKELNPEQTVATQKSQK